MIYGEPFSTKSQLSRKDAEHQAIPVFWDEENKIEYERNRVIGKLSGSHAWAGQGCPFFLYVNFNHDGMANTGMILCGETGKLLNNPNLPDIQSCEQGFQKLKDILWTFIVCEYPRVI